MAGLSGTGRVADDLYLVAHNDVTGRPYVQPRPLGLGLGLAGGLLAELALADMISAVPDHVVVRAGRRRPGDELAGHVLDLLAGERERHPMHDWLRYLARTAATDVAGRLAASGF